MGGLRRWMAGALMVSAVAGLGGPEIANVAAAQVSAASYVHVVCVTVGPFEARVTRAANTVTDNPPSTPAQGKVQLERFVATVSSESATAVTQLKRAGVPEVPNGAHIAATLLGAFESLSRVMGTAETQVKALSTTDASAFSAGAKRLSDSINRSLKGISTSLHSLNVRALEVAVAADRACVSLEG